MQLDMLWKYQQADAEVDHYENEMRIDPDRQKLIKHRNFLVEQQNAMKKLENDVSIMADRLAAVRDEAKRLEAQLADEKARFVDKPADDIATVQEGLKQIQRTCDLLSRYEQELQKLRKDADTRDRQQREIRVRAAKVKAEFDQLRSQYDQKFKAQKQKLDQLKATAAQEADGIDPKLMTRYKEIRKHCFPPMALLSGDRCGGCNMSLPSVVMRDIHSGEKLVECDNCGRIIFAQE